VSQAEYPYLASEITGLAVLEADEYGNIFEEKVNLRTGTEVQGDCRIGAYSEINGATIYPKTTIGLYCSIARGAAIGAPNHPIHCLGTSLALERTRQALEFKETHLGSDVWIGANAVVVGGITVGHGAVIGAGAVVTKDVEPYGVVVGVPARTVRLRFAPEICEQLLQLRWWELAHEVISALPHGNVTNCIRILKILREQNKSAA
jgi:acetyltransferase-like isoleucine patch superfamily enzyme